MRLTRCSCGFLPISLEILYAMNVVGTLSLVGEIPASKYPALVWDQQVFCSPTVPAPRYHTTQVHDTTTALRITRDIQVEYYSTTAA